MSNRFVCKSMSHNIMRFQLQIGDYSTHACKGYYTSPEFGVEDFETKWSILVYVNDGADHENFIDVRLKRHKNETRKHYVHMKTSIVSCIGYNTYKNENKILFNDTNEAEILAVSKESLKGCFGLTKLFILPNDTLTLQCDLEIHESIVSLYQKRESFQNDIFRNKNYYSENFAHSRLVKKSDDHFFRRIKDFSIHAYEDCINTPEYQSESLGGEWSLVLYPVNDRFSEYLDIRLSRRNSYELQLVKVILSIIGHSGKVLLSKDTIALFNSSREVQLLYLTDTSDSFVPDDTLTLHCQMVLLEQHDDIFGIKEDFEDSIITYGYSTAQVMPYLSAIPFILIIVIHFLYPLSVCTLLLIWNSVLNVNTIQYIIHIGLGIIFFGPPLMECLPKKMQKKYHTFYKTLLELQTQMHI